MNPYASFLGNLDPLEVIAATAERLKKLMDRIGREGTGRQPAPGKWSVREILCHMADCELVFAFRLRQSLAETYHVIQPFDQDQWASRYGAYDAQAALVMFSVMRDWNAKLLSTVPPDGLSKLLLHPERGEMSFGVLIETMAGHDLNHLQQIEAIAESREKSRVN